MIDHTLRGTGVALATPFTPSGEVDYTALTRVLRHQLSGGVDFLCILATTGETPTLTETEKSRIITLVREAAGGKVPIVLGYGGNDTASLVKGLQQLDPAGLSALLSVCPYYNKPSQEGLYRHFRALAEASPLPIILYNVPGRTGVNLQAATTLRLAADCKNIVAVKEASGDMEQIKAILRGKPDTFSVLSGDDALTLEMIGEGATGVISVIANALPKTFGSMVNLALAGEQEKAAIIDSQLQSLYELLTRDGNPAGLKALLSTLALADNVLRLPLVPATAATCEAIAQQVRLTGYTC